jgi:hypothetical protein
VTFFSWRGPVIRSDIPLRVALFFISRVTVVAQGRILGERQILFALCDFNLF